jgi:hypothetical protein
MPSGYKELLAWRLDDIAKCDILRGGWMADAYVAELRYLTLDYQLRRVASHLSHVSDAGQFNNPDRRKKILLINNDRAPLLRSSAHWEQAFRSLPARHSQHFGDAPGGMGK